MAKVSHNNVTSAPVSTTITVTTTAKVHSDNGLMVAGSCSGCGTGELVTR
ncbi:hypothetical protein [Actinokineospora sp. 24-640]